ncbi:hydroxymethylglutaryl-CoA reductase (NADPH) [Methanofollis aquaemaris]|uniref:3-hydroxy-3-methylglutaryl coenzyme A reductase n=1 Tax=Methanofollis aquaemaris TaxID=126734 RepID=A0A8A3S7D8_9EURY|nr:hydroxymethylglutaryl-CoA reductase (NADPH) [Methanofollis aquaemaris]QSZ67526.1 hydroxymethylglutaryl-CoA reductase (NADPH) [Methanofollis aquaemaris]
MDDALARLKKGTLKLYALEKELPPEEAVRVRRNFVEGESGADLAALGSFSIGIDRVVRRNIENMIGAVQIPVGVAGPVRVNGEYAAGEYYLPLATTEGALVASANRGTSAITKAGGADVRVVRDGMTRAPVFAARDIVHAKEVADWATAHFADLTAAAEKTTSRGKLLSVTPYVTGTSVFLRCAYDTKDAMGMNMATIATAEIADLVEAETGARLIALSGNMCTDKKPAAINLIEGRGKTVVAGVRLSDDLIRTVFKTDAATMVEVNYRKNLIGSARAGALGFNAHAANLVAAMYLACGQDPAHVVEGSSAITTVEATEDGGVYVSVTLPAVQVGTVGGGTGIDTQAACLRLLGVAGGGEPEGANAKAFAELVGVGVLAGELSLLGALAAHHLARAHKELGRG